MKKTLAVAAASLLLCSCGKSADTTADSTVYELNEQTVAQLQVEENAESSGTSGYIPLNYETQAAIWLTYMNYSNILEGKSEEEFTNSIKTELEEIADSGFNTVYVHVSAFNDAYYKSEVYAPGKYYGSTDFDPLDIVIEQAHKLELSVHGWVNPLRCQTSEEMERIGEEFRIGEWYGDSEKKGTYLVETGGRWYLNPAYEEVRSYICSGIKEISENYDIDGIHIDDYFYPDTDESFDAAAFAESGESSLEEWRTENISLMVSKMYQTVKAEDENILFGISPQGNIDSDYKMYADVKRWSSESGYCDYIVPQLYYGFENESCPFEKTLEKWRELASSEDIKLVAGICTYKIGSEDKWAGSGKNEWIENSGIPAGQTASAFEHGADGVAVYSYESTFKDGMDSEAAAIAGQIKEYTGGK